MATTIGSLDLNAFSDLYSDSTQYFWFEGNASASYGAGVHITLSPDTSFISNPTGQNILMNTDGISIRNGLLPMMTLDNDSLDFNFIDTTANTYTTMATFGLSGMRIYSRDSGNNLVQLANIGYGEGTAQIGTAIAPYYTFGIRASGSTVGNYSMAEGNLTTASGPSSHAEGIITTASGISSHAEGFDTYASDYSHAEGCETSAVGSMSHVSGSNTIANKDLSYAIGIYNKRDTIDDNERTVTRYFCSQSDEQKQEMSFIVPGTPTAVYYNDVNITHAQVVKYRYNKVILHVLAGSAISAFEEGDEIKIVSTDLPTYLFTIGNGEGDENRSNALTVDWDGNVEATGEVHGTLSNPTISITASTGTLQSATVYKQGNVVQLLVSVRKTSATASGQDVFKGTIDTTALRPKMITTGGTYYGSYALNAVITADGVITIRNADSRQLNAMTLNGNISFTYLID